MNGEADDDSVRLLREELQLLQEPGSHVGEVVKVMGKKKVLVKVQPEGKYGGSSRRSSESFVLMTAQWSTFPLTFPSLPSLPTSGYPSAPIHTSSTRSYQTRLTRSSR